MGSVIVGGARTPIGKLSGALASQSATDLGAVAIAGALQRAGVRGDQVDYVVMGHVLQAGTGQLPARQAAVTAGIPLTVPAITVNKVCLSGLNAIALADQLIRAGECEIVVAGGMESMTLAPHLMPGSRAGYRYGDVLLIDSMAHDGLTDALTGVSMGALTEQHNEGQVAASRAEQDAYAVRSHQRAAAAVAAGTMAEEIVEVRIRDRFGEDLVVTTDEGVRGGATTESLGRLRPAFGSDGTITAASASPLSDGAAAVVVTSREVAERLDLTVLAEIGAHAQVAGPDSSLQLQPARAIESACKKQGIGVDELQLIEINEAFAAVGIASARALGLSQSRPTSGSTSMAARSHWVIRSALLERAWSYTWPCSCGGEAGVGVAALCGGGGQGDALILTVPAAVDAPSTTS